MKKQAIALLVIAFSFAAGAYYYSRMPELMASHWGIDGQVNGYLSKFWALFLMPIISLAMLALFIFLPKIDPLKASYAKFRNHYDNFILFIIGFLFYVYILTIIWNSGTQFDMTRAVIPAFAILLYCVGILLEHAKSNWFVGIRTPWTLSSPAVWDKTNKLGAKIFKIFGVASLLGIILGGTYFWWLIMLLVAASLYLIVYSYLVFRQESAKK